jgi:hypothetical protein
MNAVLFAMAVMRFCATDLPVAKFDPGGMSFDLEKISAERFNVPAGGLNGCVFRNKDSDSDTPVVASLELGKGAANEAGECRFHVGFYAVDSDSEDSCYVGVGQPLCGVGENFDMSCGQLGAGG